MRSSIHAELQCILLFREIAGSSHERPRWLRSNPALHSRGVVRAVCSCSASFRLIAFRSIGQLSILLLHLLHEAKCRVRAHPTVRRVLCISWNPQQSANMAYEVLNQGGAVFMSANLLQEGWRARISSWVLFIARSNASWNRVGVSFFWGGFWASDGSGAAGASLGPVEAALDLVDGVPADIKAEMRWFWDYETLIEQAR